MNSPAPQPLPNVKHIKAAINASKTNGIMADAMRKAARNCKA